MLWTEGVAPSRDFLFKTKRDSQPHYQATKEETQPVSLFLFLHVGNMLINQWKEVLSFSCIEALKSISVSWKRPPSVTNSKAELWKAATTNELHRQEKINNVPILPSTDYCPNVRKRFPWTLIPVWFEIYLSSNSPGAPRSCCWWYFKSEGLKSHQDFWGRLTLALSGLTVDPRTACSKDASASAFCVIRTNLI